ncbi:MAG: GGDEF domain-containing protein, partial [Clostridia bacterium]|nr:GGDEF domain-containing protein [Clostridia bacterium]
VDAARTSCRYQREAELDPLTGLYNRRAFFAAAQELLAEALLGRRTPVVAVLDLNGMKEINDTWGHQAGDEALKQAAPAIQKSVREGDVVARYGGGYNSKG